MVTPFIKEGEKMILTLEEAKNILRVDFDDDDERITNLINSIPEYLENKTGSRWDNEPINPLVKTLSGFLLASWYDSNFKDYDNVINNMLATLTPMAREQNGKTD